jgi:hypothetical protein
MAISVTATSKKTLTQLNGKFLNMALLAVNGLANAGINLALNVTAAAGVPTAVAIGTAGTGYTTGQVVSITQGGASGGFAVVTAQSGGVPSAVALLSVPGITPAGYTTANGLATVSGISVPHGLPEPPIEWALNPGPGSGWGTMAPPDATNFYIILGSGGAAYGWITAFYGRP